jgi:uncharacterized surface protein with fasciclin (FAS1) repeats
VTNTLIAAGLTAALGALRRCKMEDRLNTDTDVTIFVPNNDAFKAIGSLVDGMTVEQLTTVLNYHVVPRKVLYSQQISGGGQALTAEGAMLNFRTLDGELFVNSARIVQPNLLIANGVVHVCDGWVILFPLSPILNFLLGFASPHTNLLIINIGF